MAYIESHQGLGTHRKTMVLKRLLHIKTPQAIGHLHLLWWWALDNTPDGNLSSIADADLADVAEWPGDPKTFVAGLAEAGFIDSDTRTLHDWADYTGRLIDRRRANRERQQAHRNALRTCDVTSTSQVRHGATVPYRTVPYPTLPKTTTPTPSPAESSSSSLADNYRKEIGELTPAVAAELELAEARYPAEWISKAIGEAAIANQRNWRYIAGILANWRKRGDTGGAGRVGETSEEMILGRYSRELALEIAEGRHEVLPVNRDLVVEELRRRGIPFTESASEEKKADG